MANRMLPIPLGVSLLLLLINACKPEAGHGQPNTWVKAWVTTPDQQKLLFADSIPFSSLDGTNIPIIRLDRLQAFQEVEGFGFTLTGGSATLLNQLGEDKKAQLLQELFGNRADGGIGISYLRISLGASDLSESVFSYNDLSPGQTDTALAHFSLGPDTVDLIPILKKILAIRPSLKIMASPWSAPAWMKSNGEPKGGSLLPQFYSVYADYFVKYIQQMAAQGISLDAVTPQNEPQHGGNNPSMVMSAQEQADFVKNHLGPAFREAGLSTKIIVWDHNCDQPEFPIAILDDAGAKPFVHGSAFHLYSGEASALSKVHEAHPDKALYFTEQWTGAKGTFDGDFQWHIKNVIIGTMRNWSRTALEWNLANDPSFGPHTPGGCTECMGALTIDGQNITRNVSYYIIGQASRFVWPGSVRIASEGPGLLPNVAFSRPDGKTVLLVLNDGQASAHFLVGENGEGFAASLGPGSAGTYVW
jgi:glucosylceramidase